MPSIPKKCEGRSWAKSRHNAVASLGDVLTVWLRSTCRCQAMFPNTGSSEPVRPMGCAGYRRDRGNWRSLRHDASWDLSGRQTVSSAGCPSAKPYIIKWISSNRTWPHTLPARVVILNLLYWSVSYHTSLPFFSRQRLLQASGRYRRFFGCWAFVIRGKGACLAITCLRARAGTRTYLGRLVWGNFLILPRQR